ncbi:gamma-glutamyltranspeptidase [Cryobacterium algoritolerans]|uniref:Gamma-glutamyltranspeptidase n=1 Tax=Cryobacterium algoritolerans TaxID=1259184 RepID=A0A4R8WQM4_9MICO|nr:gamma-glutamyltransferase [Cryobacterium algoritolerans]TFC14326.1 gamma-glutamyltranspeptidase [Cryobacterium algoritolerans]
MTITSVPLDAPSATVESGAIATSHVLATAAGEAAYAAGGNAIDAALAAAAALAVVYPHNTALGGDLVALIRTPTGQIHCVNATGVAALSVDVASLRERYVGKLPERGVDSISLPGTVAGWQALRGFGAVLPWAEQFNRAIEYAVDGVPVSPSLATALSAVHHVIEQDAGMVSVFFKDGEPLREGDQLRQPALAISLKSIATNGPDEFYRGDVGQRLVNGLSRLGAPFTQEDFSSYRAEVSSPISVEYQGHEVFTSPPNTQGFILLRVLQQLKAQDIKDPLGCDAGALSRLFAEGNQFREELLADPRYASVDVNQLLTGSKPGGDGSGNVQIPTGDTVGIAAADSGGFAVSLIQSVYFSFGSAVLEPSTGILMQNRGMSFSLDDASPNVIAPGKRPSHTLMPVLVTKKGALRWANATMGGKGQPQIHAQALHRLLAGSTPEETVSSPRWIVGPKAPTDGPETIYLEANLAAEPKAAIGAIGFRVHEVPPLTDWIGHLQVVAVNPAGFTAASDPRSDGSAVVVSRP